MIRRATYNDILQMISLLSELFSIEDDFAIDTTKQKRGLELLIEDLDCVVLVSVIEERIVAMASMQRLISTVMGGYVGFIEDVIVADGYRGSGIGKALIKVLIEEAKILKWGRLALGVDQRNESAIHFYEKYGFETGNMGLMYKKI